MGGANPQFFSDSRKPDKHDCKRTQHVIASVVPRSEVRGKRLGGSDSAWIERANINAVALRRDRRRRLRRTVIFVDEQWENGATIQFVGEYQAYRLRNGEKNPKWNRFSGYILDVKESRTTALLYFLRRIEPLVARDVVICCVPS